ncbi:MAG: type II toxin-antitoxin system RelE/ParE family toxin [Cyclobacteriaceae bacterium]
MSFSIELAEAAEVDIRDSFLWYENQKKNLGSSFEEQLTKAIDSIQSNPFKTQIRYQNIRVFFLKKFPLGIHFQVNEPENKILILGLFHTSLDPVKWKR